jgi:uncharacterized protein YjbI with pentapeptide repeats
MTTPNHTTTQDRRTRRNLASVAVVAGVAFVLIAVGGPGAAAQEPTGSDQILCPTEPLQAAGRNFATSPLEGPTSSIDLRCADLQGAVFEGTDLSQADLSGANLSRATFRGATMIQTNLSGAVLRDTTIQDSNLGQAVLRGADLRGVQIRNAELTQVELPGADLVGAVLVDVDLGQADLTGARLVEADLTDAQLSQTQLVGADLSRAVLHDAVFTQAHLDDAVLAEADLSQATAIQSYLVRADLRRSNLTETSFTQSDLSGADLTGATVTGADFAGADLTGARTEDLVGVTSPFPRTTWIALAVAALLVVASIVGLVVRLIRRFVGPQNPYDTPLTLTNTTVSFVLVPAMACVQAAGVFLVICSVTGVISSGLNPLVTQQAPPILGDLVFQPSTIVVGFVMAIGGGIARSFAKRF